MANSRYGYVRSYEREDVALPSTYLVVRIDGKGFHRFANQHGFSKPNDRRALDLMNEAARRLLESESGHDIILAFGESDEYSFIFDRSTSLFGRRSMKILTTVVSLFTSLYVRLWPRYFPTSDLNVLDDAPSFDGRLIEYPHREEVIDYLKWRQVDTHVNNLYNTAFWCLVQKDAYSTAQAHETLRGTNSGQKNEILFSHGINYDHIEALFRKGSLWTRSTTAEPSERLARKIRLRLVHDDIISDTWWSQPGFTDILLR